MAGASSRGQHVQSNLQQQWPGPAHVASTFNQTYSSNGRGQLTWPARSIKPTAAMAGASSRGQHVQSNLQQQWPGPAHVASTFNQTYSSNGRGQLTWPARSIKPTAAMAGASSRGQHVQSNLQQQWPRPAHVASTFNQTYSSNGRGQLTWPARAIKPTAAMAGASSRGQHVQSNLQQQWPRPAHVASTFNQTYSRVCTSPAKPFFGSNYALYMVRAVR